MLSLQFTGFSSKETQTNSRVLTLKLTYCRWLECLLIICLISSGWVAFRLEVSGWFSSNSKQRHSSGMWNTWFHLRQTCDACARSRRGKYWNTCRTTSGMRFPQSGFWNTPADSSSAVFSFLPSSSLDKWSLALLFFLPRFILSREANVSIKSKS